MPVGEAHPQALASGTAVMAKGHIGGSPGLVDEVKALRVQIELAIEPVLALLQDVGAVLLDGVTVFFTRHAAAHEVAVKPGSRHVQTNADQRQA